MEFLKDRLREGGIPPLWILHVIIGTKEPYFEVIFRKKTEHSAYHHFTCQDGDDFRQHYDYDHDHGYVNVTYTSLWPLPLSYRMKFSSSQANYQALSSFTPKI